MLPIQVVQFMETGTQRDAKQNDEKFFCLLGYHCSTRCHSKCHSDVDYNAAILVSKSHTAVPLSILTTGHAVVSIVQGADWHYGPTEPKKGEPDPKKYIKDTALVTGILSLILFVLYLVYQVLCTLKLVAVCVICI